MRTAVSERGYIAGNHVGKSSGGGPLVKKKNQVVYVSDTVTNEVFGYDQTGGLPFITIAAGFAFPQGLATDNAGNLYVADTNNSRIVVFAPGSTSPSMTISDPNEFPAGVAVSGNYVYVTNIINSSGGNGGLIAFNKKTGKVYRTYSCPTIERAYFVAVDAVGNVYVDDINANTHEPEVVEFAQPGLTCGSALPPTLGGPGGLQFDKSGNLVVDDQEGDTISYAPPGFSTVVAISDNGGSEGDDPVTIALAKGNATIWTANAKGTLTQWPYPASGTPSLTIGGFSQPVGVATFERGNK